MSKIKKSWTMHTFSHNYYWLTSFCYFLVINLLDVLLLSVLTNFKMIIYCMGVKSIEAWKFHLFLLFANVSPTLCANTRESCPNRNNVFYLHLNEANSIFPPAQSSITDTRQITLTNKIFFENNTWLTSEKLFAST